MDYKTAGVDVEAGRAFVDRIKSSVESTHVEEVIGGLGGFAGLMRIPKRFTRPILVAGTDGVGTKLELAQAYEAHSAVGIDLVAMCINDVITCGAEPLFFLDYIATGKLGPEAMVQVVEGISHACKKCGCAILGGETAEMPGFYSPGKYDLAGFCVAAVEESLLIDGSQIQAGDQVIGVGSSGLHSNGFSLVRKILEMSKANEKTIIDVDHQPLIQELLKPTSLYYPMIKALLEEEIPLRGMAHITGGGLVENLPRCLPVGKSVFVDINSWERPQIFNWLQNAGDISEPVMWETFNLGIGFCIVASNDAVKAILDSCRRNGFEAWTIGVVEDSSLSNEKPLLGLPF